MHVSKLRTCRTIGFFVRIASMKVIVAVVSSKIYVMVNENFIGVDIIGLLLFGKGNGLISDMARFYIHILYPIKHSNANVIGENNHVLY